MMMLDFTLLNDSKITIRSHMDIIGVKQLKTEKKECCELILEGGHRILVQETYEEVMGKL